MLAFERRWVLAILGSFAPEGGAELAPRADEVDYLQTFTTLGANARSVARLGMRVAVWIVALAPCWLLRRGTTFVRLSLAERQALLARLLEHRVYAVREAAFFLKLCACLALFANDEVRARSGYDAHGEDGREASLRGPLRAIGRGRR